MTVVVVAVIRKATVLSRPSIYSIDVVGKEKVIATAVTPVAPLSSHGHLRFRSIQKIEGERQWNIDERIKEPSTTQKPVDEWDVDVNRRRKRGGT